jgi:uncharacterized protein (TIGR02594 family)
MVAAWMPIAQAYVGTDEIKGAKHNPVILEYFDAVGHGWVRDDETPWCAAFVGACLEEAGYKSTGSLAARSYLNWGKEVEKPKYGDIVVFWRGSKQGWQGHVAFFVRETKDYVYVLGGNQGNSVNVSRYSKSRVLGYRQPSSLSNSRTVKGAGGVAVGTGVTAAGQAIAETADKVNEARDIFLNFPMEYVQWIGLGIVAVSVGLIVYARWDDLKKKGR